MKYYRLFLILIVLGLAAPAGADEAWLPKIESYLNSIQTVSATFRQEQYNRKTMTGTLDISKPGDVRLEYKSPGNILLVATDNRSVFYDKDLDEISYFFTDSIPFHFLLEERVSLSNQENLVFEVAERQEEVFLTVTEKDKGSAPITFVFGKRPMELLFWFYPAPSGERVEVHLDNLKTNHKIEKSRFVFKNPRLKREF